MEYAFNDNFKQNNPITESPHELINHYVTTKMSLYLNRALLRNKESQKNKGKRAGLFPPISLVTQRSIENAYKNMSSAYYNQQSELSGNRSYSML